MTLELQFKIKSNPNYQKYLRENSHWYKILNRNPNAFVEFEEEMKERYKLRPSDKFNSFMEKMEIFETFFSILKA